MDGGATTFWKDDLYASARADEHSLNYYRPSRSPVDFRDNASIESEQDAREDVTVALGELATFDVFENARQRKRLLNLIDTFATDGVSFAAQGYIPVSDDSRRTAVLLIKSLPRQALLPRIAPDEDGGLVMVWASGSEKVIVSIEDSRIYCVEHAGTDRAEYHDDLQLEAEQIPAEVISAIRSI